VMILITRCVRILRGKCGYLEIGKRLKHIYFKRLFHTGVADLGTILQLYNCRRKAAAKIAVTVVMLTPNKMFLRLS
jgi:hypothetical protein